MLFSIIKVTTSTQFKNRLFFSLYELLLKNRYTVQKWIFVVIAGVAGLRESTHLLWTSIGLYPSFLNIFIIWKDTLVSLAKLCPILALRFSGKRFWGQLGYHCWHGFWQEGEFLLAVSQLPSVGYSAWLCFHLWSVGLLWDGWEEPSLSPSCPSCVIPVRSFQEPPLLHVRCSQTLHCS